MFQAGRKIRFRLALILANHWWEFVETYGRWIRPVVFETVRKLLACQTPALGCHVYRCPCGESRIEPHSCKSRFCPRCDERTVRFSFKDYARGGKTSYKTLPVLAFIRRLICHIPDKHFKMVRYAGIFATRWKVRHLAQARAALGQAPQSTEAEPALSQQP